MGPDDRHRRMLSVRFVWTLGVRHHGHQQSQKKDDSEDERIEAIEKMVRGLAHAKIVEVGKRYLEQSRITLDDLDEFNHYLYYPYSAMGGNGYAKKVAEEVNKIPLNIVETKKEEK